MVPPIDPPDPELTDGTVVLRPFAAADAPDVALACNDPEIQRFIPVPQPYELQHATSYIEQCTHDWADGVNATFAIRAATDDQLLGAIRVSPTAAGTAGYWVAPWARGRGVAAGALGLICEWGLGPLGMHLVLLEIREENVASLRVALACGFHQVGRLDAEEGDRHVGGLLLSRTAPHDEAASP